MADARTVLPRLLGPWPLAAVAVAGVAVVAVLDPNQPGNYPVCPFYALTGLYCPGCGALRATHALAHGDVGTALGLNLLYVLALPWLVAVWALWVRRRATGRVRSWVAPAWLIWGFLATEVLFTVARNLPWFAVLAP